MLRLAVTTIIRTKNAGMVWFPCEVAEQSIDEVYEALRLHHIIKVQRLETEVRNSVRRIINRYPTIVGIDGVATIVPLAAVMSELTE